MGDELYRALLGISAWEQGRRWTQSLLITGWQALCVLGVCVGWALFFIDTSCLKLKRKATAKHLFNTDYSANLQIFCPQRHQDLMITDHKEKRLISASKKTAEDSLSGLKMNEQILKFQRNCQPFFALTNSDVH